MANANSSRSHSIFQIMLQQKVKINNETHTVDSIMRIVDLAGSEKF